MEAQAVRRLLNAEQQRDGDLLVFIDRRLVHVIVIVSDDVVIFCRLCLALRSSSRSFRLVVCVLAIFTGSRSLFLANL